jgi:hypothetical protein
MNDDATPDQPSQPASQPSQPATPTPAQSQPDTAMQPQSDATLDNQTIPQQKTPSQQGQQPPVVLAPVPHTGIRGFIDNALDSLAGKTSPKVYTDQDGNAYIQHPSMSRGQQWLKIGTTALRGAAAGMAAGKGAGNQFKALQAGIQAGDEQSQQQKQEMRQQMLDAANSQKLKHEIAAQSFALTRMGVKANQEDVEFADKQADRVKADGGDLVGTVQDLGQLTDLMKDTPGFMDAAVKENRVVPVPNILPDGSHAGFKVFVMPQGLNDEMKPPGSVFHTFDPISGKIVEQKTTGWTKASDLYAYDLAATNKSLEVQGKQAEISSKQADAAEKQANAGKAPSEIAKNKAEAANANSEAGRNSAEANLANMRAAQIKSGAVNEDGTPNPRFEIMAKALLNGDILPGDLKREAKGANLDPNEVVGRAMEMAQATGQHFSLPIIEQEHKFASNPKTQAALDGIDRILGAPGAPGYMDQMLARAEQARLSNSGAENSVALWLKGKFGDTAAKNFNTSVAETRRSIAGLIGNPLLGGSETDKKLEQADEMLGQSPTIENLKGAANVLRQALVTQRNSIVQNNRYLRQRYGSAGLAPQQQAQPQPVQLNPGESPHVNQQTGQQIVLRNNQWVDVKTGQPVQ